MIYFDNASTSWPKPECVISAISEALRNASTLRRGTGEGAEVSENIVYDLREKAADFFGAPGAENVILTMNATHALNIVIKGMLSHGGRALISGFEHNAVTRPLYAVRENGVEICTVPSGLYENELFLEAFSDALRKKPDLVCLNCVSNAYGWILPFREAALLAGRAGIPVLLDASQAAGHLPVTFSPGVEFIATAGHKGLFGPGGTGLLLTGGNMTLSTLLEGGTGFNSREESMPKDPPERFEAGTINVPGVAGLSAGIDFVRQTGLGQIQAHEKKLLRRVHDGLSRLPRVKTYACRLPQRQSGLLSFTVEGETPEAFAEKLSEKGVAVRAGLHCAPMAHDSAGNPEGSIRLSFSVFNTEAEVDEFLHIMSSLLAPEGEILPN